MFKKIFHYLFCVFVAPFSTYSIYRFCPYNKGDNCGCWNCPAYHKNLDLKCKAED